MKRFNLYKRIRSGEFMHITSVMASSLKSAINHFNGGYKCDRKWFNDNYKVSGL